MNVNDVIKLLQDSIRVAKDAGTDPLLIKRLEAFATEINSISQESPTGDALPETKLERYKAKLSAWVGSRQHEHEWNLEMLRSVTTTGQSALKSSLLINGAAAVALLAFIGNIWNIDPSVVVGLSSALGFYVVGVLLAALAAGVTYLSQAGFGREFNKCSHAIGYWGRILAGFCSSFICLIWLCVVFCISCIHKHCRLTIVDIETIFAFTCRKHTILQFAIRPCELY